MTNNPVGWFEIYVSDLSRAKTFYQTVFEVKLESLGDPTDDSIKMLAFPANMDKYGATGALVKMDGYSTSGNGTLIYFSCEDCSIEESRVNLAGGAIQKPKMSIGEYGFISLAEDTEGNLFGLHSLK